MTLKISLENKIALVTGASRGIGKEIVITLAENGAYVVGTEITKEGALEIDNYLKIAGLKGSGKVLDVTVNSSIEDLFKSVKSEIGDVSILVNNAGITKDNLMMRMKEEEWLSVINTNLNSIFRMTQACIRDMIKARFGRIISISSIVGTIGNSGQVNYCAAKAGILGFTKSLAREVASRGITVNAIAPGYIDTVMTQKLDEKQRQVLLQAIPIGRVGTPKDIANSVLFLSSDEASYITGQTLHVNGGMYMS